MRLDEIIQHQNLVSSVFSQLLQKQLAACIAVVYVPAG